MIHIPERPKPFCKVAEMPADPQKLIRALILHWCETDPSMTCMPESPAEKAISIEELIDRGFLFIAMEAEDLEDPENGTYEILPCMPIERLAGHA